jgi:hypothetical protein
VKPSPRRDDPEAERAEIAALIADQPPVPGSSRSRDGVGRLPVGPARGWRGRERKAKSCEICEGDLWVEGAAGEQLPCECRDRRAANRARNRLRAGNWWRGTSLSFAAPPLAQIGPEVASEIHRLCDAIGQDQQTEGLWLIGDHQQNKSAVCAYLGQRLYPANKVAVEHLGDLLAHLRWLGAIKGEAAVEAKLQALVEVPLLVIDDLDRPVRTFPTSTALALRDSASSRDLIRLVTLLDERMSSLRPLVVTTRVEPSSCAEHTMAISRPDLVRALLASAGGTADPLEDFPSYTLALVAKVLDQLQEACRPCHLAPARSIGEVA